MAIANNKSISRFFIEDRIEAGLVLKAGKSKQSAPRAYSLRVISIGKRCVYLVGCHITALPTASTHQTGCRTSAQTVIKTVEINKLIGKPNVQVTPSCRWLHFHAEKSRWKSVWQKVRNSTINDKV